MSKPISSDKVSRLWDEIDAVCRRYEVSLCIQSEDAESSLFVEAPDDGDTGLHCEIAYDDGAEAPQAAGDLPS